MNLGDKPLASVSLLEHLEILNIPNHSREEFIKKVIGDGRRSETITKLKQNYFIVTLQEINYNKIYLV